MTTLLEAAKQALGVLDQLWEIAVDKEYGIDLLSTIKELRQAIEQAEKQEPVNWTTDTPVPPFKYFDFEPYIGSGESKKIKHSVEQAENREWVELTDDDIENLWNGVQWSISDFVIPFTRAIEAKLKEKNGGS